jgi:hypothetical protein
MFFFFFDIGSAAEWAIAIAEIIIAIGTFWYALPAIRHGLETLRQMKTDTSLSLRLFELQNRPYLSLLPDIKLIVSLGFDFDSIKQEDLTNPEFYRNPINKINVVSIVFQIKNHGNLPATILEISLSNATKPIKLSDIPRAVFPHSIAEYTVYGIPEDKVYLKVKGEPLNMSVDVKIIYSQKFDVERYEYSCIGEIDYVNKKFIYSAEFYEMNDDYHEKIESGNNMQG